MNTLVAIGSDGVRDYSFPLVFSALLWRSVVDFEPRVFLVGTEEEWRADRKMCVALDGLLHHNIDVRFIPHLEGYKDATVAQHVRFHAAADLSIHEDRWVMLSDADLWPLRRAFFVKHEAEDKQEKRVACYYSNGDHFQGKEVTLARYEQHLAYQSLPACHIVMRAKQWRELYNLVPDDVTASTKQTLDRIAPWMAKCSDPGFAWWCSDQWTVVERLCRQDWFPEEALMIDRYGHPPAGRLDRGNPEHWLGAYDPNRWIDAHIFKAPDEEAQWTRLLTVVDVLLPEHAAWARDYRERFVG